MCALCTNIIISINLEIHFKTKITNIKLDILMALCHHYQMKEIRTLLYG